MPSTPVRAAPPATPSATPLTRARVLAAALSLADAGGIESLSMRRLGREVGVEAMSLYNHVSGKDDILDGIVDLVFGEIDLPTSTTDWQAGMRHRAYSARDVLARHSWAASLMQSRTSPGSAMLRHHDTVIGTLRRGGFSVTMAAHAFSVIDSYIYGFAQQQQNLTYTTPEEATRLAESILEQVPATDYPHLAELLIEHAVTPDYDYAAEFDFGLELILSGLQRLAVTGLVT
ncbi:TetR/AcrR family transcriptional regulator C-terminal domain-containing protein [Lapillicoccus sp.]|uniref:TetR/AcrR family transcriptional regulator C-terminal domain-containing protein n=1 Tax=Lapillicoccus sp. TaxID=1909287 RepID=UPI0032668F6C